MDVVLDTNVLISAAINSNGVPADVIRAWDRNSFGVVTSLALITELERVINSARLQPYMRRSDVDEILRLVHEAALIVEPVEKLTILRDEADDRVLEAAVAGDAEYVVSGDNDLLSLGSYEGIEIISPVRFLAILATLES